MGTVRIRRAVLGVWWVVAVLGTAGVAEGQINSPGNHLHYAIDLEPHLVLQWSEEEGLDEGLGLGMRVSWPVVDNGPLPEINNTLAVSTGADITFQSGNCRAMGADCDGWQFWLPVAAQWNFYFSQTLSLFAELGLAIQYVNLDVCELDTTACSGNDDVDVLPVFWLGGRYTATDKVAFVLRLGFPSLIIGASFFF